MSSDKSARSFLAARDARQAALERALRQGCATTVLLSLNIPGAQKMPPGAPALFRWALSAVHDEYPQSVVLENGVDALGGYAILGLAQPPLAVKTWCIGVETRLPAARLIDLDVYTPDGAQIGRQSLGLPARACLLCQEDAVECMRRQRHLPQEVVSQAEAHLAPWRIADLETWAAALVAGATRELYLTPKPGLVDRADCGSHPDLTLAIMEQSIALVADYLAAMVRSLVSGEPFACQQRLGLEAERTLFRELGTNTHKGYVFLSGMLLIARWHAPSSDVAALRATLGEQAAAFFRTGGAEATHGQRAREKYNASDKAGGVVDEAIRGYPAVFSDALPAFRRAIGQGLSEEAASFAMLARLMQTVDDTTTLHRGGAQALARLKRDGRELQTLIERGGDYPAYLVALNADYIGDNITLGGVADMLGLAYACLQATGELAPA
jgi:triphosphoribosyl-dephospho-CoA synthase